MKLRISSARVDAGGAPNELEFAQAIVTFGRSTDNTLSIPDPDKQVSNFHGQFELRGEECYVTDLDSTNGTLLNGSPLQPRTPLRVQSGDVVAVGAYQLSIELVAAAEVSPEMTIVQSDPRRAVPALVENLIELYAEGSDMPRETRLASLRAKIAEAAAGLAPDAATTLIEEVAARFHQSDADGGTDPDESADGSGAGPAGGASAGELQRTGLDVLRDIARHFVPDKEITSAADVARFGRLLRQQVEIMLDWLARGLEGRREFDDQIGAEVTMLFNLTANPLKAGRSTAELGRFLLDWTQQRSASDVGASLDGAFRDLHLHQLGLLAGAQKAVDAALGRLDPQLVQERVTAKGRGLLKLVAGAKEWEEYKVAYGELQGSRAKLFDELIAPAIRQAVRETFERKVDKP